VPETGLFLPPDKSSAMVAILQLLGKTDIVMQIGFDATFGASYCRITGQMIDFIQKPHMSKPANMPLMQFTAGADHPGIVFTILCLHHYLSRIIF
jgi:hypothetical protein